MLFQLVLTFSTSSGLHAAMSKFMSMFKIALVLVLVLTLVQVLILVLVLDRY